MYKQLTFTILFSLLFFNQQLLFAQCNVEAPFCENALPITTLPLIGQLPTDINNSGAIPGCNGGFSFHNSVWYEIMVTSTTIAITVNPLNCGNTLGMQAGLFTECGPNAQILGVQCACTVGPMTFAANGITPGPYFVMLDGCSGDICDFEIIVSQGTVQVDTSTVLSPLNTPSPSVASICPNAIVTFTTNIDVYAEGYTWNLPLGVVPIEIECNRATVIWGPNSGEISVTAYNSADTVQSPPFLVEITDIESSEDGFYCLGQEPGYFYSGTGTYYPSGTHTIGFTTVAGCDSTVFLTVTQYSERPDVEAIVVHESCGGLDDGKIFLNILNPGIGPFTYQWSDSLPPVDSAVGLAPGFYLVEVTGQGGCTTVDTIEIISSINLHVESTFSDCDTLDGTATVSVIGGGNITYAWSNGGTGSVQTDLAPGGYSVTATSVGTDCRSHRNVIVSYDTSCVSFITGNVYEDILGTCVPGNLNGIQFMMVMLNNGQAAFTDFNGNYEFEVFPAEYTVSLVFDPLYFTSVCTDPIVVDASTEGTYSNNDFFVEVNAINNLVVKVNKPNPRPGFDRQLRICLMNRGDLPMTGTLTFVHDDNQIFISSAPTETNYDATSRTITWDFVGIPPGAVWIYRPVMQTPFNIALGDTVNYYFLAEPLAGDITPNDNEWSCSLLTTNAYDPNDKQVMPLGEGPEGFIEKEDTLMEYLVRFQNTGSDTAYTVVVRDTLNDNLDVETLFPAASSHPYELSVLPGNVLEFTFNNIMLADSNVNEPASHGFVFFDIQLKPNREEGTIIKNRAAIYFDFNPPVITNTVVNTIKQTVGIPPTPIPGINIGIMPNPTRQSAILTFQLPQEENASFQLYDLYGRFLKELAPSRLYTASDQHRLLVNLEEYPAGLYFLKMETAEGKQAVVKLMKTN